MTEGRIMPQLIKFALPLLVANFLQQFYALVDMAIVGRFVGSAGLSAVTIGQNVSFILTFLCTGLTMGGQVLVAQHVGAQDEKGKSQVIGTLMTMCVVGAVGIGLITLAIYKPVLVWMDVPDESMQYAKDYTFISIIGVLFIFGYNAICAVLRGMGDSKRPMLIIGISSICNIILDLVFVGPLNMGAGGAALATIMSQALSCIIAAIYLYKKRESFGFDFKLSSFKPDPAKLKAILKIGIPTAIEMIIVNVSFMFVIKLINAYGVHATAAYGVGEKVCGILRIMASAVGMAACTIEGQTMGAGDTERTKKIVWYSLILGCALNLIGMAIVMIWPAQIFALFDDPPETIEYGIDYISIVGWGFLGYSYMNAFNGIARAVGNSVLVMVGSILDGFVLRLGLAYLLGVVANMGLHGIYIGFTLAPYGAGLVAMIYFLSGRWKKRVLVEKPLEAQ
jgi:putative MATE family efflux protein